MILHLLHIFFTDALTFIMSAPRHQPAVRAGSRIAEFRNPELFGSIGYTAPAQIVG
jgi:hypothetical protein